MAAIKRSQANQRRQPDSFVFKQEQGKEQLGTSGIKVEIQHLIVAILDDPIVSRVFNEAGFSSFDIKLAMVRPLQSFWRYSSYNPRQRRHQNMFLFNTEESANLGFRPFRFPFSGDSYGDEDFRRIGDVLARRQGRNPLLFGVCAYDALQGFVEAAERSRRSEQDHFLPSEIRGMSVVSVEREILKFVNENCGEELIKSKFQELGAMVECCSGPGVLVCFGDLKAFVKDDDVLRVDLVGSLVMNFTKFLEVHRERCWLIGCATYEIYLKFLNRFPSVGKDWDLLPLAITSMKFSKGETCFKSSLMGSFVPFAGFFPSSSDYRGTLRNSCELPTHGNLFNEKHTQAVTAGPGYSSVADKCQTALPSWLRMTEISTSNRLDIIKAKDDVGLKKAITEGCYSIWDNTCQNFHNTRASPITKIYGEIDQVPHQSSSEVEKVQIDGKSGDSINASLDESNERNANLASSNALKNSVPKVDQQGPGLTAENENLMFKLSDRPLKTDQVVLGGILDSGVKDDQTSPTTGTSVATDLMLGVPSHFGSPGKKESTVSAEMQDFSTCSTHVGSCAEFTRHLDTNNFNSLFEALVRRIGGQEEAVRVITQIITDTRASNGRLKGSRIRGDIWMNFIGPDTFGMRKTALALAEVVCGTKNNFIHIDLISDYDLQLRRKTMVDHIADSVSKMPLSIVFLENLHCAHPPTQNSLLHAIQSGKFLDSHGREVGISNAIFLLNSALKTGNNSACASSLLKDRLAEAKPWPMQITVTGHRNPTAVMTKEAVNKPILNSFTKRKLHRTEQSTMLHNSNDLVKRPYKGSATCLDLNLPADEDTEADDMDLGARDFGSCAWLEDLLSQVDATVAFKPFEYEVLAEKISGLIHGCFSKSFCKECLLEIDLGTMDQILAGACLSERNTEVEDWLDKVLRQGFTEARKRYHLASHCVVQLATCRPMYVEDHEEPCQWLPSKVILNCQL